MSVSIFICVKGVNIMFLEERQELIVRMVERDGKVKVKELSAKFKVTEDCIRKDLGSLERQGRLKRTYGVSMPDYNILLALWEAPGHRLRMGELAERVVYSPSRVTYLVSNLSRDGWVERIPSAVDRRGYDACLTTQGIETVLAATELHQQTVSEYLLDGMTEADIDSIVKVFSTLDSRLRGDEKDS